MSNVTQLLNEIEKGDSTASEQLLPLIYNELRSLATHKMRRENPEMTLQATALVHDAYLRLVDVEKAQHWDSRRHFFAAAAEAANAPNAGERRCHHQPPTATTATPSRTARTG